MQVGSVLLKLLWKQNGFNVTFSILYIRMWGLINATCKRVLNVQGDVYFEREIYVEIKVCKLSRYIPWV